MAAEYFDLIMATSDLHFAVCIAERACINIDVFLLRTVRSLKSTHQPRLNIAHPPHEPKGDITCFNAELYTT